MVTDDLIELDRTFGVIRADEAPDSERDWLLNHGLGVNLKWPALLQQRRVVLLAEQSSGKSSEFELRRQQLVREKKFAFLVTVEELADDGFERSLDPAQLNSYKRWLNSTEDAWFFLDS